jgi:hypothetical protein
MLRRPRFEEKEGAANDFDRIYSKPHNRVDGNNPKDRLLGLTRFELFRTPSPSYLQSQVGTEVMLSILDRTSKCR